MNMIEKQVMFFGIRLPKLALVIDDWKVHN